jgi:enoyl-CoA hydratase/carnithine racemase
MGKYTTYLSYMVCVVLIVRKNQGDLMTYQYCTTELSDKILTVTINRPEAMNALHPDANHELAAVFDAFAADPDQWVAIITGAGERAFSAGNDLKFQAMGGKMSVPDSGFAGLTSRFDLNKPVIAAVNGVAMGGGFEIALACDLIIAADTALFALPEPKVGLAALAGGLHRLPRQIGMKHAMGMILTGRRVSATEGASMGFVNEVVPATDLMATARKWAQMITSCAPSSVRASKEASQKGLDEATLEAAIKAQYKYEAVRAMFASQNLIEGPMAFAQKRAPNWVG